MSRKVFIFDTSVLCCLLQIPGREETGPIDDRWNYQRITDLLGSEDASTTFVLPLATLIETGNHISQAPHSRFERASDLANYLKAAADAATPWAAFTEQSHLWEAENLRILADNWPCLASKKLSIGDATIKDVAEHYAGGGFEVRILTSDKGLKAYQPVRPPPIPRRRS